MGWIRVWCWTPVKSEQNPVISVCLLPWAHSRGVGSMAVLHCQLDKVWIHPETHHWVCMRKMIERFLTEWVIPSLELGWTRSTVPAFIFLLSDFGCDGNSHLTLLLSIARISLATRTSPLWWTRTLIFWGQTSPFFLKLLSLVFVPAGFLMQGS